MASRKIDELLPELQDNYILFREAMTEAGLDFIVTCTYRSTEEQAELYAQGRTKPGRKVTWTLKSKHCERKAFDIAIKKDGSPVWDVKVNVNDNEIPDYEEAGRIGKSAGLVWGGDWKTPDMPHFQLQEEQ